MSFIFIETTTEPIHAENKVICGEKQVVKIFGIIVFIRKTRYL
jgi:hypothetical protein